MRKLLIAATIISIVLALTLLPTAYIVFTVTESSSALYILIAAIVFAVIPYFTGRKIKYYCSKCGAQLKRSGNYSHTGEFKTDKSEYTTIVSEYINYEYICPHCGNKATIREKTRIASNRY